MVGPSRDSPRPSLRSERATRPSRDRRASVVSDGWHALRKEGRGWALARLTTPIAALWACHPVLRRLMPAARSGGADFGGCRVVLVRLVWGRRTGLLVGQRDDTLQGVEDVGIEAGRGVAA